MGFELIDPEARETLTSPAFPGVEFVFKPIPRGKWLALRNTLLLSLERGRRRAVAACTSEGLDPEARHAGGKISVSAFRENLDPTTTEEVAAANLEIVRWGLVELRGVLLGGKLFELGKTEVQFEGGPETVLSPETLRVLRLQRGLVTFAADELFKLNEIGPVEKKA